MTKARKQWLAASRQRIWTRRRKLKLVRRLTGAELAKLQAKYQNVPYVA